MADISQLPMACRIRVLLAYSRNYALFYLIDPIHNLNLSLGPRKIFQLFETQL